MEDKIIDRVAEAYHKWAGSNPSGIRALPSSGSWRKYFRIDCGQKFVIAAFNDDVRENEAFFSFTDHFKKLGLPVPDILYIDHERKIYLLNDLGDVTLFDHLSSLRRGNEIPDDVLEVYRKVMKLLPYFQVRASAGLDYSRCYPRSAFDIQSMMWDLNYFKYYFLKLAKVSFDEQLLEDDFHGLTDMLLEPGQEYFLYRDFQSRNIMLFDGEPWFIDYQGGRKGALQYDPASLLYDGKAALPPDIRQYLLDYYLTALDDHIAFDHDVFKKYYYGFVLIRIMQAMGAYGFRGYYENKPHFLQSIPYAVRNIEYLIDNGFFPENLPVLRGTFEKIISNPSLRDMNRPEGRLTVVIRSFSYRKGIPAGDEANGGGFVFDCRALPNPGRYESFASFSGRDKEVIDYLMKEGSVDEFLNHVFALVDQSVKEYVSRDFTSLTVDFGCTGGQHRSVFCAEKLAAHLREKFRINVILDHTEEENWKK